MLSRPNSIHIHFSPVQHARLWFVIAVVFFSLAAGSYYWHEIAQYHTYLTIGLVFAVVGIAPLLVNIFQGKAK